MNLFGKNLEKTNDRLLNTAFHDLIKKICLFLLLFLPFTTVSVAQDDDSYLKWDELPSIPSVFGVEREIGIAGHFSGVHNDVLLIAGGTNFPGDGRPWNGDEKVWYDDIYVLERGGSTGYQWLDTVFKLPFPLAYGASVSVADGLLCIGGADPINYHNEVFLLKWNQQKQVVETEYLPDLPVQLAYMDAVLLDGSVYVAGGETADQKGLSSDCFFRLDLNRRGAANHQWERLPSWPGPGRVMPVMAVQNNGHHDCLYLFSGREVSADNESFLYDGYRYDPKTSHWKKLADIDIKDEPTKCLVGGTSATVGLNHILVFGGADGEDHRLFRETQSRYNETDSAEEKAQLRKTLNDIADRHSGFSKDVLTYHTLTDQWIKVGEFPNSAPVVTQAVRWGNEIIIPGGEIGPAVRSANTWKVELIPMTSSVLDWLDYAFIAIYLITVLYIGYKYKKNIKTTNDYYKAGGRIPGWASGVAIFGTLLSAITFLTTPAKTYNENWLYFLPTISSLVMAPFIVFYIIPVYFKLNVTTAYEYLEKRFNSVVRLLGSLSFLAFQVAKFGVMLLLPALAISAIIGVDVMTCIIVIGLFSTVYGTLGGIEAVVWTEVLQVAVFLLAAILSIAVVALKLEGGFGDIVSINQDFGKFEFVNWDFSFSELTIFVALSYWVGGGLVPYVSDQTVIQKYLVTKDVKNASRGVWLNGILIVVSSVLFFFIGSALFAYYQAFPQNLNPTLPTPESIYPWFIVNELPSGVKGVVVAGIFAVAMSTISSTMNSMSAATVTDFARFYPISAKRQLFLAKAISAIFGIVGTVLAAVMFIYEVGSLWDMIRRLTGLLTGGLAGLFLLGIFTKRASAIGALIGFVFSAGVQYYVSMHSPTHFMVYSLTGMLSCFIMGYIASILFPRKHREDAAGTVG